MNPTRPPAPSRHRIAVALVASAIALAHAPCRAQHELLTGYDWEAVPTRPDAAAVKGTPDLLLKRNVISQYLEDDGNASYYQVFHVKRYLGDEATVDGAKTVEMSTGHIHEVIRIKARSVDPDGKVSELGPEAFKRSSDDRERRGGLHFAFEGLRPGSVIEYLMHSRQRPDFRGDVARLQFGIPAGEVRYEVLVPSSWRFVFKGHNGAPQPEADSSIAGIVRHHLHLKDVPALEDEPEANTSSHRMYIVHKLDAIPDRGIRGISGYVGAARNYHASFYPETSSKTRKELAALLKKMNLGSARDQEDRIRSIDRYVRENFSLAEASNEALGDLDRILRSRTYSHLGMQRLYCNLFREAGIEHQVVVTTDRTDIPFDPDFEAHNYLRDAFLHFPGPDKFFDPTELGLGLGYAAPENMGTHGLFIRNVELGGTFAGVGSVKPIPALPAEATRHDLDITVGLSDDAMEATVEVVNGMSGYYARGFQNIYPWMDDERKRDLLNALLNHFTEGATKQDLRVEYGEPRWFGVKPFTTKGRVVTSQFSNQAGDEVLLRVGELIGPQVEMYVEKERRLPVDSDFNRYYERRIAIKLPQGWKCDDLGPLSIHKTLEVDGRVLAEFRSSAVLEGREIKVDCIEYYRIMHVPVEHFEAYRGVINAAADFNKRTLLLARGE